MSELRIQEFQAGLGRLLEKARTDSAFHDLCRQDPARALREVAGLEVPNGCTLRCAEIEAGEILIPLPKWNPVPIGQAMTDSQLDAVAGGGADEVSAEIAARFGFGPKATASAESFHERFGEPFERPF